MYPMYKTVHPVYTSQVWERACSRASLPVTAEEPKYGHTWEVGHACSGLLAITRH